MKFAAPVPCFGERTTIAGGEGSGLSVAQRVFRVRRAHHLIAVSVAVAGGLGLIQPPPASAIPDDGNAKDGTFSGGERTTNTALADSGNGFDNSNSFDDKKESTKVAADMPSRSQLGISSPDEPAGGLLGVGADVASNDLSFSSSSGEPHSFTEAPTSWSPSDNDHDDLDFQSTRPLSLPSGLEGNEQNIANPVVVAGAHSDNGGELELKPGQSFAGKVLDFVIPVAAAESEVPAPDQITDSFEPVVYPDPAKTVVADNITALFGQDGSFIGIDVVDDSVTKHFYDGVLTGTTTADSGMQHYHGPDGAYDGSSVPTVNEDGENVFQITVLGKLEKSRPGVALPAEVQVVDMNQGEVEDPTVFAAGGDEAYAADGPAIDPTATALAGLVELLDGGARVESVELPGQELSTIFGDDDEPAFEVVVADNLDGLETAVIRDLSTGETGEFGGWSEPVVVENAMVDPQVEALSEPVDWGNVALNTASVFPVVRLGTTVGKVAVGATKLFELARRFGAPLAGGGLGTALVVTNPDLVDGLLPGGSGVGTEPGGMAGRPATAQGQPNLPGSSLEPGTSLTLTGGHNVEEPTDWGLAFPAREPDADNNMYSQSVGYDVGNGTDGRKPAEAGTASDSEAQTGGAELAPKAEGTTEHSDRVYENLVREQQAAFNIYDVRWTDLHRDRLFELGDRVVALNADRATLQPSNSETVSDPVVGNDLTSGESVGQVWNEFKQAVERHKQLRFEQEEAFERISQEVHDPDQAGELGNTLDEPYDAFITRTSAARNEMQALQQRVLDATGSAGLMGTEDKAMQTGAPFTLSDQELWEKLQASHEAERAPTSRDNGAQEQSVTTASEETLLVEGSIKRSFSNFPHRPAWREQLGTHGSEGFVVDTGQGTAVKLLESEADGNTMKTFGVDVRWLPNIKRTPYFSDAETWAEAEAEDPGWVQAWERAEAEVEENNRKAAIQVELHNKARRIGVDSNGRSIGHLIPEHWLRADIPGGFEMKKVPFGEPGFLSADELSAEAYLNAFEDLATIFIGLASDGIAIDRNLNNFAFNDQGETSAIVDLAGERASPAGELPDHETIRIILAESFRLHSMPVAVVPIYESLGLLDEDGYVDRETILAAREEWDAYIDSHPIDKH